MRSGIIEIKSELNLSAAFIVFKPREQRGMRIRGFKGKKKEFGHLFGEFANLKSQNVVLESFFFSKNYQIMIEE